MKNKNIKLLIVSGQRSGKDTLAEIFNRHFDITFKSSSQACSDIFIYDKLKQKYNYKSQVECFEDRVNHRAEWYNLICEYNKDDKARLAKEILKNQNIYVGMRDSEEIKECLKQDVFQLVIWVDAEGRVPLESKESFNITKSDADIIIENKTTLKDFTFKALKLGNLLFK